MTISSKNPKIAVQLDQQDLLLLKIAGFIVILYFLFTTAFYVSLPKTIPIHFNLIGKAAGFGDKSQVWLLPIANLALFWVSTLLIKKIKPWSMNDPMKISTANAPKVYGMNFKMLTPLNLGLTLPFFLLSLETVLTANYSVNLGLHYPVLILILLRSVLPFYSMFKRYKLPKL